MERIALAREYRVAEWLRDAYLELAQEKPLDIENLRPAEPCSTCTIISTSSPSDSDRNWEEDAKKWEAASTAWETVARIFCLQTKIAASIGSLGGSCHHCRNCDMDYGWLSSHGLGCLCKCRLLRLVDETFRGELERFGENMEYVDLPPPGKLPIPYFSVVSAV